MIETYSDNLFLMYKLQHFLGVTRVTLSEHKQTQEYHIIFI